MKFRDIIVVPLVVFALLIIYIAVCIGGVATAQLVKEIFNK